jgi:ribokinase
MITVVGSYNVDVIMRVKELPKPGQTVLSQRVALSHGGKGSNQAVSASRLGERVQLVCAVGNDREGQNAIAFWQSEKVGTSYVRIKEGRTGVAYIFLDERGENFIVVDRGVNSSLAPEDLGNSVEVSDVLLAQLEVPLNTVEEALKRSGGINILNPAPASQEAIKLLNYVDILTPNEVEFFELVRTTDLRYGCQILLKRVREAVVVTLGEKGAFVATKSKFLRVPPVKVKAVDSTGAGDVFNAALAVAIRNSDLEDAVEFSNYAAALSVTTEGAIGPTREEVLNFIRRVRGEGG